MIRQHHTHQSDCDRQLHSSLSSTHASLMHETRTHFLMTNPTAVVIVLLGGSSSAHAEDAVKRCAIFAGLCSYCDCLHDIEFLLRFLWSRVLARGVCIAAIASATAAPLVSSRRPVAVRVAIKKSDDFHFEDSYS
eukprot:3500716-Amphidinium_carterae.1